MEYAEQVHSVTFEVKTHVPPPEKLRYNNLYFPLCHNVNITITSDISSACLPALQKLQLRYANLEATSRSCLVLSLNKVFYLEITKLIHTRFFSLNYVLIYIKLKF